MTGAVPAAVSLGLYLSKQGSAAVPSSFGTMAVGRERLRQGLPNAVSLPSSFTRSYFGTRSAPRATFDRKRQARALCDLAEREFVAQPHAPDLANHVHGDHLESLLKFSAGQWNTLVNIGSALCGLAGQIGIGTNSPAGMDQACRAEIR